jgi:energy-coupling factor transporter ATP-binding protein EcfA2
MVQSGSSGQAERVTTAGTDALLDALERLRQQVAGLHLPLELQRVEGARTQRTRLLDQLDDYLLPRLRQIDAPLLAVVGGSTGAGKSTLVNSLLGHEVTRTGVLRPTTRSPVLVHHPEDADWFTSHRVLPSLARLTGEAPEPERSDTSRITGVRLAAADDLPAGLAVLDAPDIDSVVTANRELAAQLLGAADLWLFVTTAARYADAVPWDLLATAVERGTSVAVVLDRVPAEAIQEVRSDLAGMLRANQLASAPVFTVPESGLEHGLLPEDVVAPLRSWLTGLASDARARQMVVRRTLSGALDSLRTRVPALAEAADAQAHEQAALEADLQAAYAEVDRRLGTALTDGTLLRGEVLARWHEFVGTGEFFRGLETAISRLRDRVTSALRGRPAPAEPLGQALQSGVHALVRAQVEEANERVVLRWRARPAGAALLSCAPDAATRLPTDFDARLERLIRDWQRHVFDLVREEGQGRRAQARVLSFGVNGIGVVLMLAVFAGTGGLTGGEIVIAGGSAALAQRLLEAVFGDQAVRELAAKARRDLLRRVDELLAVERDRLSGLLAAAEVDPQAADRLRATGRAVQEART